MHNGQSDGMSVYKQREMEWKEEVNAVIADESRLEAVTEELKRELADCEMKKAQKHKMHEQEAAEMERTKSKRDEMEQEMNGLRSELDRLKKEQSAMIQTKHQMLSVSVSVNGGMNEDEHTSVCGMNGGDCAQSHNAQEIQDVDG